MRPLALASLLLLVATTTHASASLDDARQRVEADIAAGRPLVAHVIVALCDNDHQGIIPVPRQLGDGQDPRTNLYWGAAYGVRTFFARSSHWKAVDTASPSRPEVLATAAFRTTRSPTDTTSIYVIAEAWDGREMKAALTRFFRLAAGHDAETMPIDGREIEAGGAAHLVAFVGHDGLMDGPVDEVPSAAPNASARVSVVLACMSRSFFGDHLEAGGSHALVLTTGLMAPEAYTLDAIVRTWFADGDQSAVCAAAADAYWQYQHCSASAARGLFSCTE